MWIKICPTCNGTGQSGGVTCPTCNGNGIVPSADPADQYNVGFVDAEGVKHVLSMPNDGTVQPWMTDPPHDDWKRLT